MNKRGQTWSFDLIIAVVLFIAVMSIFYGFMARDSESNNKELQIGSEILAHNLNCDYEDSSSLCVIENGNINEAKLIALYNEDYEIIKAALGIKEDFCIYLKDTTGNLYPIDNKTGVGNNKLILTASGRRCGENWSEVSE